MIAVAVTEVVPLLTGALALVAVKRACRLLVCPLQVVPQGNCTCTDTLPDDPAANGLTMLITSVSLGAVPTTWLEATSGLAPALTNANPLSGSVILAPKAEVVGLMTP